MTKFNFKLSTLFTIGSFCLIPLLSNSAQAMGSKPNTDEVKGVAAANTASIKEFTLSPDRPDQEILEAANCIVSISNTTQGGFIVGATFGRGLVTCRTKTGEWSRPSYYDLKVGSVGLQAGLKTSDILMVFIGDDSRQILQDSSIKLGGDINVIVGRRGLGGDFRREGTTVVTYTRDRGLMVNLSLNGAMLKTQPKWNQVAYGNMEDEINLRDILETSGSVPKFLESFLGEIEEAAGE